MLEFMIAAGAFVLIFVSWSLGKGVWDTLLILGGFYMISTLVSWVNTGFLKDRIKELEDLHKAELKEKLVEEYKKRLED